MALLTMHEIQQGLEKEFAPLEPMLTGFRLIAGGLSDEELETVEQTICTSLPAPFRELIKKYNFGKLSIGPVYFCSTGDYGGELLKINTEIAWWGMNSRPNNLLMIANSDPYSILLNLENGEVEAMDVERGWRNSTVIACSFDLFIRGIGTTMIGRNQALDRVALGCSIASEVGSTEDSYWLALAK